MACTMARWVLATVVVGGLAGGGSACQAEAPDTGACKQFVGGFLAQQEAPHVALAEARESIWNSYRGGVEGCTVLRIFTREGEINESIVRFKHGEGRGLSVVLTVRRTTFDRKEGRRITAISEFYPTAVVRLRRDGDGTELSREAVADGRSFVLKFLDGSGELIPNQGI